MPIYEYQCEKCGHFEVTQKITGNSLRRCPTCKGKVKKLISNTSFQLKGTGWYITDYARKEKGTEEKKGEKAPAVEARGDGKAGSDTAEKPAAEAKGDGKAGSDTGEKPAAEKKPAKSAASESAHP